MINTILLVFAFVLALIEALRWPWPQPWGIPHLGWFAVALFFLTLIIR